MGEHTISETEARERFSELVDWALAGEDVRITRGGEAVVELRTIAPTTTSPPTPAAQLPGHVLTLADWDWLVARRVGTRMPDEDAGTFVSRQRNEEQI